MQLIYQRQRIRPFCFKNDREKIVNILNRHEMYSNAFDSVMETVQSECGSSMCVSSRRQSHANGLSQIMSNATSFSRESMLQIKKSGFNFRNSKEKLSRVFERNSKDSFQTLDLSEQINISLDQQQTISQKNKQKFNFRSKKSIV